MLIATALALFIDAAAVAPPADCHDPVWIAAAHQPASFDCAEIGGREVTAVDGRVYRVRAVRDEKGTASEADDQAPLYLDAIAHALKVYDGLGLPAGHVSIVFYAGRDAAQMGAGRETGAPVPLPAARATIYGPHECLILVPMAGLVPQQKKAQTPELRYMAAHLVVHCLQAWRWPASKAQTAIADAWWAEGSADALASAAEPLDRVTRAFIATFDRASPVTALTAFAYEASPFFMWLWRSDPGRFDALSRCVAHDPARQTECLVSVVGAGGLNGFARAYLQNQIVTLRGEAVPVVPQAGATADGAPGGAVLRADVAVTTLWRARIRLGPGRWTICADRALPVSGLLETGEWRLLGTALDIPCCGGEVLVYAMPTAAAEQRFAISAIRTADGACPGR